VTHSLNTAGVFEREVAGLAWALRGQSGCRASLVAEEFGNQAVPAPVEFVSAWEYLLRLERI
jgi:hypothetical protein